METWGQSILVWGYARKPLEMEPGEYLEEFKNFKWWDMNAEIKKNRGQFIENLGYCTGMLRFYLERMRFMQFERSE